jgi:SAM-dependent methyltransferase
MKDTSLKTTFNEAAKIYDVRPSYPEKIIEEIISLSGISKQSRILEVGVGTGQITLLFAKRGYEMVGLELGPALAEQARKNLQNYPNVNIVTTAFEDWQSQEKFDLLLSAQAFHWIETDIGVRKAAEVLNRLGSIALIWNFDVSQDTDFYKAVIPLYEKYMPDDPNRLTPGKGFERFKRALSESLDFQGLHECNVTREITYSKESFLKLRNTFSNHLALSEGTRAELNVELSKLIDSYGGNVLHIYKTVLLFARRLGESSNGTAVLM